MKTLKVIFKTRSRSYWIRCPHCSALHKMSVWAIAHQNEDLIYTCESCNRQSRMLRRACDLADKVDE
jgi:uncharacterized C2H2 Zn-finger protein